MEKTWDEFIARQVEAALRGERESSQIWTPPIHGCYKSLVDGIRTSLERGDPGIIWVHVFGPWGPDAEYWFVNLTLKKVLHFRRAER